MAYNMILNIHTTILNTDINLFLINSIDRDIFELVLPVLPV